MAGRFSVDAVFRAVDRVTAPVNRMQNRVGKFTRSINKSFNKLNRNVDKFAGGIKRVGLAVAASMAIAGGAMANVINTGADFEQAITNVGAVSLQTRDQIAPLEKLALKLGATTKFTATQSAQAMEIMARAGFKTNEILAATPAVLAAAAASGLEIAEVANVVSNALKGMGLEAAQAGEVADILALASARTNSSIGSLGESLKNVASTAKQLNIPITQTVAAIALLQDVGLDASVAGSAFNVMLTKMAAPTTTMQKKMKKLGITFKDAKGNMLPLSDVLNQLNKASKKVGGNFDKVAFLAELVGLRGQKAAANLGDLFESGKLETLTRALENAKGSAEKMAAIRMNTFQGSVLLLQSAIDGVKVRAFNLQNGPLKGVVDQMTKWVEINGDMVASRIGEFLGMLITNMGEIVTWAKRIGIALASFFAFVVVLKTMVLVMTAFNLVMALNPIGLMVLGVVALVAGFTLLAAWLGDMEGGFGVMGEAIQAVVGGPMNLLIKAIQFVKDNFGAITDAASGIASFATEGFSGAVDSIADAASGAASFLGLGDDEESVVDGATGPQIVSPQERVARSIEEQRTTSTSEITLKTEPGTSAEVTGGKLGAGLQMQSSGGI